MVAEAALALGCSCDLIRRRWFSSSAYLFWRVCRILLTLDSADAGFSDMVLTISWYELDAAYLSVLPICIGVSVLSESFAGQDKWRAASNALNSCCSFVTLLKYFCAWLRIWAGVRVGIHFATYDLKIICELIL